MKKILILLLALCLVLCGCGKQDVEPSTDPVPTTEATEAVTEPVTETTEPATEATEPVTEPVISDGELTNPLTGEPMDAPLQTRVFGVTINNVRSAVPHYGVSQVDLFFEMFVNNGAIRGLAMFSDITQVEAIGSVRSMRYNFTDIAQAYDAFIGHAGGNEGVLEDANNSGVDHFNIDTGDETDYSFRDFDRNSAGHSWEHCLFAKGEGLYNWAEENGYRVTQSGNKAYGMSFTDDGTPEGGETAETVTINFKHFGTTKTTTMIYNQDLGKYVYNQYGQEMVDAKYNELEAFENVFVIIATVNDKDIGSAVYHIADLLGTGEGYYACGGQLIPIQWYRDGDNDAFYFTTVDGMPLYQGVGNSYIAIAPTTSSISWE